MNHPDAESFLPTENLDKLVLAEIDRIYVLVSTYPQPPYPATLIVLMRPDHPEKEGLTAAVLSLQEEDFGPAQMEHRGRELYKAAPNAVIAFASYPGTRIAQTSDGQTTKEDVIAVGGRTLDGRSITTYFPYKVEFDRMVLGQHSPVRYDHVEDDRHTPTILDSLWYGYIQEAAAHNEGEIVTQGGSN